MKHGNEEIFASEILRLCGGKPETWAFVGMTKALSRLLGKLPVKKQDEMIEKMKEAENG